MKGSIARCPDWLVNRLEAKGGETSFYDFMDMALNDPKNGAYGGGNLKIGKKGDFCTSPSLSNDFAKLLSVQIIDWFKQLQKLSNNESLLSLIEIGPGEGTLSKDIINFIIEKEPSLKSKLELILVEQNSGMKARQCNILKDVISINIRWLSLEELSFSPLTGIVIANEVLDAFPVERIIFKDNAIFRQGVSLIKKDSGYYIDFTNLPANKKILDFISQSKEIMGVELPPKGAINGWCTEWHCDLPDWFEKVSKAIKAGPILIIDYALEAKRYYSKERNEGTLISYRSQIASPRLLESPGKYDLTSHLCIEAMITYAKRNKINFNGITRQGQALLALGLSNLISSLHQAPKEEIHLTLEKRESLLRLVDPIGLGEFRWLAFEVSNQESNLEKTGFMRTLFLEEPIK